jgi:acetyltransferase-like isoleucine patch superfamily enzyme
MQELFFSHLGSIILKRSFMFCCPLCSKGPVIVRNNVWIGEGVVILPGVTIGEISIIGANSVVSKDVPANAVVAGVPAVLTKFMH